MLILNLIGLLFIIAAITYISIKTNKFIKDDKSTKIKKENYLDILYSSLGLFLGIIALTFSSIVKNSSSLLFFDYVCIFLGYIVFSFAINYLYFTSALRLYKPSASKKIKVNYSLYILLISLIVIFSLLLALEGIAPYFMYPLPNGVLVNSNGLSLINFKDSKTEGFKIAFYGLFIVFGAIIAYLISDYKFFKKYHKHGIIENLFLVAFPAGVIGARLWFCLVLEPDFYLSDPIQILYVWNGGMAIMGGALLGMIAGIIYMLKYRKDVSIFWAIDTIVPTILIAQAIGRWGNFFNHEVYGQMVDASKYGFLPTFILNQMSTSFVGGEALSSQIFVPLFLIESLTNISGYFIITSLFGKKLSNYTKSGDLGALYIVWYGITRAIMEPLRYGDFKYGNSWYTSFVFIGVGIILIIVNHYIRYKKQLNTTKQKSVSA